MADIIFLQPGLTQVISSGPQYGVPFTILGPDGSRAVFNDPANPDYVGSLSSITGFDSPDVREAASELVEADGGMHGSFYYGRRPVVIEGQIDNRPLGVLASVDPSVARNVRMTKLQRATNAMRSDATITWMPDGGVQQQIAVRRQQPLRISGGFNKTFQAALVSADHRIYSVATHEVSMAPSASATTAVTNIGSIDTPPIVTLFGPFTNPTIYNTTAGGSLVLATTVAAGQYIVLDFAAKTAMLNGVTNVYSAVNFVSSTWWSLVPGDNAVRWNAASGTTGASTMRVTYRDAWI